MEIRVLNYFLAVAREQSISGAANFLHLSQPTLSRQLKELEDEFGKQLFIRGNKKITLTDEGILFRKRAEEIIDLVRKTENEMFNMNNTSIEGNVFIGTGETEAIDIIAKEIKKIQKKYPNIKFNISSDDGQDVIDNLDKGLIDFGIILCPVDTSKYNYITLPIKDTWGVLMKKDDPLAKKDYITPKDIKDRKLIISRQIHSYSQISNWFGIDINKLNIVATYNLIYNASILVKNDLGITITLDKLINTTAENSEFAFRPLYPRQELELNIIWKRYQVFSKPAEKFLEYLKKGLQSIK